MSVQTSIITGVLLLVQAWAMLGAADPPGPLAGDWPCWRGPQRNAVSQETGLLQSWPAKGPALAWTASGLGRGYSTPSVSAGRVFGLGDRGDDEVVWALDAKNGKELWHTRIAGTKREIKLDPKLPKRSGGKLDPRSTPSVDGGRVYALGIMGDLVCLEAATGKLLWQRHLVKDLNGSIHYHGYTESPLLDGNHVVVCPGGKDTTMIALDKFTGKEVWRSGIPGTRSLYSSAIVGELGGQRMIIQFLQGAVAGVDAGTGKLLWRVDIPQKLSYSIATPLFHEGQVFIGDHESGGILTRLSLNGDSITATLIYSTNKMRNQHGGMVLVAGHLYGCNGDILTCLDFKTGKVAWSDHSVGKGSLIYADGHLYVRGERGGVALVEATPRAYIEKGRFNQPKGSGENAWSHPVLAGGKLFLRDQDLLFCYDLRPQVK